MKEKRFRIALSFAGEKREFLSKIAAILAERLGRDKILYDDFHKAEFARPNLRDHLLRLYREESNLIVVVVCPDYKIKQWTGLEWEVIRNLVNAGEDSAIMLTRFALAHPEGLSDKAGFIDLDDQTPEETAEQILRRLALNEGRLETFYTMRELRIRDYPPRVGGFFGREEELKQVQEALRRTDVRWLLITTAEGGSGKTSLAVHAVELLDPPKFKDVLFLSAKQQELDDCMVRQLNGIALVGWPQMMIKIGELLGLEDIAKHAENDRACVLRKALSGTQTLLILDNLESLPEVDQQSVVNFVKTLPDDCKALLTSRKKLGNKADRITLAKLSEPAALQFLDELAKHERLLAQASQEQRLKLYQNTNGNPLLLRWIVGQLGEGSCTTVENALNHLSSRPVGNDPLEFVFRDLLAVFDQDEILLLASLTFPELPIGIPAIVEISGVPQPRATEALNGLVNRSVVVSDKNGAMFSLIPMVNAFLHKTRKEKIDKVRGRLAVRAYKLIMENGFEKHGQFAVLDSEWPTIRPALPAFIDGDNQQLQEVCAALFRFLDFTGRWDDWSLLELSAERRAVEVQDYLSAGWRSCNQGWFYYRRKQAHEVLACVNRAEDYWRMAGAGRREAAFALRLRGIYHEMQNDNEAALDCFRKSLEIHRELNPEGHADVARGLNDIATIEGRMHGPAAAEVNCKEALRIAQKVGFAEGVAGYTGLLAQLALDQSNWSQAEQLAREALKHSESIGRKVLVARDCLRLSKSLAKQGKPVEAASYARKAVKTFKQLESPELDEARTVLAECKVA